MKYYHADQLATLLLQALTAFLFVQNGVRRFVARVRYRRMLTEVSRHVPTPAG